MRTVFFSYLYIFVHRGLIKHISIANEISVLVYNVSHTNVNYDPRFMGFITCHLDTSE